jgi:methylenetetrahydrofolate reductase (NADPH)
VNKNLINKIELLQNFTANFEKPAVSFEFFPPKNEEMDKILWNSVEKLAPLKPKFVSVTYGAGGSTKAKTYDTVKKLNEMGLNPAAHLTCVNHTKAEIEEVAKSYLDIGVKHIVALRGDMPDGGKFIPHPEGYKHSSDLVLGLKKLGNFEISVAAFPEVHPEAENAERDLEYLKRKIDCGADRAITQYFMEPQAYLDFLNRATQIGINKPIVPGILMISNFKQFMKFSAACGAKIPKWVVDLLDGLDDFPEKRDLVSYLMAVENCRVLRENGIDQFHFYTLNRATLTHGVCHVLGVR